MVDLHALTLANGQRWKNAHVLAHAAPLARVVANKLEAAKSRYQAVEASTGVPWAIVAVIHERESSQSWRASLAQGDPWDRASIHVPKGRGPFPSWEAAAIDALQVCPPHAARWTDWTIGGSLCVLEQYNGLGYANGPYDAHGEHYPPQASPYIWSGTDQYRSGKYVADGHFDPHAIDQQIGCAAMLSMMMTLDGSIAAELHA